MTPEIRHRAQQPPPSPDGIAENLATTRARIAAACAPSPGSPAASGAPPKLIAVSKGHPAEAIATALAAGQRVFGENRVQEAAAKFPALRGLYPDLELHLIGPLQTNKVRQALVLFDVIQTVDRPKLAQALAADAAATGCRLRYFVQVNTGAEPQKSGVLPDEADALIELCRDRLALDVEGLMCIPPIDEPHGLHFALLAKIAKRNNLGSLSMGMSDDFELAIRFGATHLRIGTAIFGERGVPREAHARGD